MSEVATKKDIEELIGLINKGFTNAQEHADKRFEQVDKRFEQVDKRFEQVDKRFDKVEKEISKLREETARRDDYLAEEQQDQRERIEAMEDKLDLPHPEKQHV
jgi:septal ring factor EnvC (AmiA/AmiB activator)